MSREHTLPNEENSSLKELEAAIVCSTSVQSHSRLVCIRALLRGHEFDDVLDIFDVTSRTLQRWISEFNEQGIDGIIDRPRSGRPQIISAEKATDYRELIENPNLADEHFWTGKKFHGYLVKELQEEISYRSTIRFLHAQGYNLKVPRSMPVKQDDELRKAYLERLSQLQNDSEVDIWFLDETGIEGDPRPRRRWSKKGSKPTIPYTGNHIRMNVCGMVCPSSGEFIALEFDFMDRVAFQVFLDFANEKIRGRARRQVVICDNASWHRVKSLNWGALEVVFLPPYSPDFNPIERLWLRLKSDYFFDFIAKSHDTLIQRLEFALCELMTQAPRVASICAVSN
jgi:transposase